MALTNLQKFPGPYFGGKADATDLLWRLLGDPSHYVVPFCGSCVDLLRRPHPCNRAYYSETVNDADGLLVNALRSIQLHGQATAEAASWYVAEADLMARHLALLAWVADGNIERLCADPTWCDPRAAGWWLWGLSCWIGGGWCTGDGPWVVDPATGRIVKQQHTPGVSRQLPHLSNDGRGVMHPGTREPGVMSDGQDAPDLGALEPWRAQIEADYAATGGFHPMTMPELRRWFAYLEARFRHVRILCGDYQRLLTTGTLKMLNVRRGTGHVGVFLDPPYSLGERDGGLYRHDATPERDLAAEVRAWCLAHGSDPELRIVLAGFTGEGHEVLEAHGWTAHAWFQEGYLKGGMANLGTNGHQQHRERLWASPHCCPLDALHSPQLTMF